MTGAEPVPVHELQPCSFLVEGREPDTEYRVQVGDRDPEPGDGATAPRPVGLAARLGGGVGRGGPLRRRRAGGCGCGWPAERGCPARIKRPRWPRSGEPGWLPRTQLPVYVNATKISEDRYNVMVAQLRALAAGLVFDLYSKMFRSLQFAESAGAVSSRSSQMELRLLERLWASLAPALQEVAADPVKQITVRREVRPSWGGERLGQRTVARLAAEGLNRAGRARRGRSPPTASASSRRQRRWNTVSSSACCASSNGGPPTAPAACAATSMGSRPTGRCASAARRG